MPRTWSVSARPTYVFQHAHPSAQFTTPWYCCSHRLHVCHRPQPVCSSKLSSSPESSAFSTKILGSRHYEPYLARVVAAGGFRAYEKRHIAALVATFAPKFSHLPEELVGIVMMFYAHVGFY